METKAIEGVKTFLNDIINNANRLTSGNIAHNGNAIRLLAESTLSMIDEALAEQDRIARQEEQDRIRQEERERCIKAVRSVPCALCLNNDDPDRCRVTNCLTKDIIKAIEGGNGTPRQNGRACEK